MTTAVETMKEELLRIEQARAEINTDYGVPKRGYAERDRILTKKARALRESIDWMTKTVLVMLLLVVCVPAQAYTADEFCDAIYHAEGGENTRHPYGVLSVSCETAKECRRICINSYNNNQRRFANQSKHTDFVDFFGSRWAPVGATNDPQGLNVNWVKNVRWFLDNPKAVNHE